MTHPSEPQRDGAQRHTSADDGGVYNERTTLPRGLKLRDVPPPTTINMVLAAAILIVQPTLLLLADSASSWPAKIALGALFALIGLPLYSLMHEGMHRCLHPNNRVNDLLGAALSALFPGPFSFLRATHTGHHRRNRTDAEMFDSYYPGQGKWRKRIQFYLVYTGLFWLSLPIATLLVLIWPAALRSRLIQDAPAVSAMVNSVPTRFVRRVRTEAAIVVGVHLLLILVVGVHWTTWLLLYGMLGVLWSSQNYITHAFAPRHVMNGAYNLAAPKIWSLWLLNFNWHLAHHQHPAVPWIHLPQLGDPTRDNPSYIGTFIRFWRGPQPATEPSPKELRRPVRAAFARDAGQPAPNPQSLLP